MKSIKKEIHICNLGQELYLAMTEIDSLKREMIKLKDQIKKYQQNLENAAEELLVEIPEPNTVMSKLLKIIDKFTNGESL